MSATNDLIGSHDLLIDELSADVCLVLVPRRRRRPIERDIPALGAHDELRPRDLARRQRLLNRGPDGMLGSLASIVDRRIDQVDAGRDRGANGRLIRRVVGVGAVAEVGADPDRRDRGPERGLPEVVRREVLRETLTVVSGAGVGRAELRSRPCRSVATERGIGGRFGMTGVQVLPARRRSSQVARPASPLRDTCRAHT